MVENNTYYCDDSQYFKIYYFFLYTPPLYIQNTFRVGINCCKNPMILLYTLTLCYPHTY